MLSRRITVGAGSMAVWGWINLKSLKRVQKESERLRMAVSDLTPDKYILSEAAMGDF